MAGHLSGRELRTVAWLVLLAKKYGPQLLDDPGRFDKLVGAGQFATVQADTLELARCYVEEGGEGASVGA